MQIYQINVWYRIVENFTRRSLSVRADYSHAISGIASELASYWDDEYLAGTWRQTLANNLAWQKIYWGF